MTELIFAAALAASVPEPPGGASPAQAVHPLARVVDVLHDGRFEAADAALAALPDARTRPDALFFRAFVTYWRLLYDDDNPGLRVRLERQLSETIDRTEARKDRPPADVLWSGSARLLLSQLRAIEKKPFAAALEAKRARRDLQAIDGRDALAAEALFGLGTYNYMADRLPAFVKGLRALLFLPGGDRDLGLRQLERAAQESRYFFVEARLLLVTISSNRHERLYDAALEHAAQARKASPDALVVAHASARLLIALGRSEEAAGILDRALARTRTLGDVDAGVAGTLELLRARADFALFRPDLAATRARALSATRASVPEEIREGARVLAAESASLTARPWWPEIAPLLAARSAGAANGNLPPSAGDAERDAVVALFQGRAALASGQTPTALDRLAAADASGNLPAAWIGPCRLLAGQAADLQGLRPRAVGYYKKAAEGPRFPSRDAALAFQVRPYGSPAH